MKLVIGVSFGLAHTVSRLAAMSMVLFITFAGLASAHEIRPAIADVTLSDAQIDMTIQLTAESLLSGINLDGLEDTDDAPDAEIYDQLRAAPPEALTADIRDRWDDLRRVFIIETDGQEVLLDLGQVSVEKVDDPELPRDTTLTLSAPLPMGDAPVQIGWDAANGPLIVRQAGGGDEAYAGYLDGGTLSEPLPRTGTVSEAARDVFMRYIVVGFDHIIPKGLDHILFVLGLFFLSYHLRLLLMQVTIFTVAHTITLALASLKIVTVSPAIVEPLIAASIVYVAVENIFARGLTPWRPVIIFLFGLLHGLGFASVLGEFGLAPGRFIAGLIGFNVGVEIGQLAVIALAFLLVWLATKAADIKELEYEEDPARDFAVTYRAVALTGSIVIAVIGTYWAIERAFF